MFNPFKHTAMLLATTILVLAVPVVVSAQTAGKTLANLQEAFNGESNAQARYLAFAEKADAEGFAKVASTFRAAAKAESIHAANHAEVIRSLGGEPKAAIVPSPVKSTAENLTAAVTGESYERDTMYPDFIAMARQEGVKDALKSFNYAIEAEAGHAKLYSDALASLDAMKGDARQLFVCPVCGRTELVLESGKCPVCFTKSDKYIAVS